MNAFQQSFARALLSPGDAHSSVLQELVAQPGFAVYRNTVAKGCVEALEANFPTVLQLVGREWFRGVALAFAQAHPPHDGRLLLYGDTDFPSFLQDWPTAAGLPWLAGVARLDALWHATHANADAEVLVAEHLAGLTPEALAAQVLLPHPATHWLWFDAQPVASIWLQERSGANDASEFAWRGEGLLFTRTDGSVRWERLSQAGCALLDACANGCTLGEAAVRCLGQVPEADLSALLQQLLQAGAFTFHPRS